MNEAIPTFDPGRPFFSPQRTFEERIAGRKVVYLDHCVWITLRDAESEEVRSCRHACVEGVRGKRLVFPMSRALIWELARIPDRRLRERQALLVDELSLGTVFRDPEVVIALESIAALESLLGLPGGPVPENSLFTNVPDFLGDTVDKLMGGVMADWASLLPKRPKGYPSVQSVLDAREAAGIDETRPLGYAERIVEGRLQIPRKPKSEMRNEALWRERIFIMRKHVLPVISWLCSPDDAKALLRARGPGGKRRYKELVALMPVAEQQARVHFRDSMESSRLPQDNDFFDNIHTAVPVIYSDVFASWDNRVLQNARDAKGKAVLASSASELLRSL